MNKSCLVLFWIQGFTVGIVMLLFEDQLARGIGNIETKGLKWL